MIDPNSSILREAPKQATGSFLMGVSFLEGILFGSFKGNKTEVLARGVKSKLRSLLENRGESFRKQLGLCRTFVHMEPLGVVAASLSLFVCRSFTSLFHVFLSFISFCICPFLFLSGGGGVGCWRANYGLHSFPRALAFEVLIGTLSSLVSLSETRLVGAGQLAVLTAPAVSFILFFHFFLSLFFVVLVLFCSPVSVSPCSCLVVSVLDRQHAQSNPTPQKK